MSIINKMAFTDFIKNPNLHKANIFVIVMILTIGISILVGILGVKLYYQTYDLTPQGAPSDCILEPIKVNNINTCNNDTYSNDTYILCEGQCWLQDETYCVFNAEKVCKNKMLRLNIILGGNIAFWVFIILIVLSLWTFAVFHCIRLWVPYIKMLKGLVNKQVDGKINETVYNDADRIIV